MPNPPKPRPVAPNLPNTLAPALPRLPLGLEQEDPAQLSVWRIWIPTNAGGTLTVHQSAGSTMSLRKPAATVLATGRGDISYVVRDGTCGDFYVTSSGDAGTIRATFVQIAWSRESEAKDAAPMLPWNFWYWPSKTGSYFAERAKQVIGRYATSLGRSASEFGKWEAENHEKVDAEPWAGHCHNAAPATMLFETPIAVTIGEHPTEFPANDEEVKFLAAEYFGNFGVLEEIWKLDDKRPAAGERPLPAYLKPGVSKTRAALVRGLTDEFGDAAPSKAEEVISQRGGESAFAHALDTALGKLAARFYGKLVAELLRSGQLLMANARSYGGGDGAGPVWNQVFFYFEAIYEETPDREDDRDITITCSLYSNIDHFPSADHPATISRSGRVTPGASKANCQVYVNVWRIIFDEGGDADESDSRCAWQHLTNGSGEELYAPTSVLKINKTTHSRQTYDNLNMLGNPIVGQELLKYLKIRKRYQ